MEPADTNGVRAGCEVRRQGVSTTLIGKSCARSIAAASAGSGQERRFGDPGQAHRAGPFD